MKKLVLTSGHMAYLFNSLLPGLISLGLLVGDINAIFIYLTFLLCHILTAAYYRNKGVAARFNVAQSSIISILSVAALLVLYCLFGHSSRVLYSAVDMAFMLKAAGFADWVLTIGFFLVAVVFFSINIICWRNSQGRIFPLPVVGGWAWQSAVLDDISGEYAPLEEATRK